MIKARTRASASCRNRELLDQRRRLRNGIAIQLHAFQVEFIRFASRLPGFFKLRAGIDAPMEVGEHSRVVAVAVCSKEPRVRIHLGPTLLRNSIKLATSLPRTSNLPY